MSNKLKQNKYEKKGNEPEGEADDGRSGEILRRRRRQSSEAAKKFFAWLEKDVQLRQEPLRHPYQTMLRLVSVETVDGEPRHTKMQEMGKASEAEVLLSPLANEKGAR